jgi:hypothetical protein
VIVNTDADNHIAPPICRHSSRQLAGCAQIVVGRVDAAISWQRNSSCSDWRGLCGKQRTDIRDARRIPAFHRVAVAQITHDTFTYTLIRSYRPDGRTFRLLGSMYG